MGKIHQLPVELSNQIAAGEVIERPSSVVKELLENSIDAQADQIIITVEDAGLKLIEINDNGTGIASDDVENAFQPHSTSKISDNHDLFNISTLGFRGEALASIASVSKVEMITSDDGLSAVKANFEGNELLSRETSARPQGTTVKVRDLFFNTPARLKYVKSLQTELNKIVDIVDRIAIGHPELSIRLINNGKDLIWTSGNSNLPQTISGIYGRTIASSLLKFENSDDDYQISGYFSKPEVTRSNRSYISIILNGRYIKNYALNNAIIKGYGSKLMIGRFPIAIIKIDLAPSLVDINVHPTKQEVRLTNEGHIAEMIRAGIENALGKENLIPDALTNLNRTNLNTNKPIFKQHSEQISFDEISAIEQISEPEIKDIPMETPSSEYSFDNGASEKSIFENPDKLKEWDERLQNEDEVNTSEISTFPELRYVGQAHGTYLIADTEKSIYFVDQHAAQERVNYEFYREEIAKVDHSQQPLLVPIVLDYQNTESILIKERMDLLNSLGLYLEEFGQNSFVVNSHPTWFVKGQEESTIREMIDYVLNDKNITLADYLEKNAIMMSCKRAIKANQHLDEKQARYLLEKLSKAKNPYNCPHGRPVLVEFSDKDLEKMFKRIQDSHDTRESE
ncbi:DNA mismatch repair endonuclease MutL [Lactobacillus terrae]|uniref:DNA mismatch repair endonuclease MutL n=1 Tax=Lactobacillus terrae TaxID=2269374 RepID=UPI000C1B63D6|nr:DNA mismatch repair endonuclease MutL [Lactobacillus terrae]